MRQGFHSASAITHANEEIDCKSKLCEWKEQLQPGPALSTLLGTHLLDGAEEVRVSLVENGHELSVGMFWSLCLGVNSERGRLGAFVGVSMLRRRRAGQTR